MADADEVGADRGAGSELQQILSRRRAKSRSAAAAPGAAAAPSVLAAAAADATPSSRERTSSASTRFQVPSSSGGGAEWQTRARATSERFERAHSSNVQDRRKALDGDKAEKLKRATSWKRTDTDGSAMSAAAEVEQRREANIAAMKAGAHADRKDWLSNLSSTQIDAVSKVEAFVVQRPTAAHAHALKRLKPVEQCTGDAKDAKGAKTPSELDAKLAAARAKEGKAEEVEGTEGTEGVVDAAAAAAAAAAMMAPVTATKVQFVQDHTHVVIYVCL